MKTAKKVALIFGIVIVVLLGAALALPVIFKDDIVALVKQQINENVNAVVEFGDVSLSLLRSFPDVSLSVENFSVTGVDQFEGIRLASGERLDVSLDLMSVLRRSDAVQVKTVSIVRPDVHVYVLRDGTANYNIALPAEEEAVADTAAQYHVALRRYSITGGSLIYDDRSLNTYVRLSGLDHSGSGNFTRDIFDLVTTTDVDSLTVRYGSITYLENAGAKLDAIFSIDQSNSKYTLKDNILTVNALHVKGDGFVQLAGDDYNMDLHLTAPENDFKNLLSIIPNAYTAGYENVKATGQFSFVADVKGAYNGEREQYPAFNIDLQVDDASVKYPDLPLGITDINAKAVINSPGSDFDDMVVDVSRFRVRVGNNPFTARLNLKTPVSDPDIDAEVKGAINLDELKKAYPMDGMETLAGVIRADITAKTRLSYIEQKAYERVNLRGDLNVSGLRYQSAGLPLVVIDQAQTTFSPERVRIEGFEARLGRSDLQASGTIDNILAYISPKKTMTGQLTLRSRLFDVNEWYDPDAAPASGIQDTTTAATDGAPVFDRFNLTLDARADEIVYDTYRLVNTTARGQIAPNRMDIDEAATQIGDSDFRLSGTIIDAFDYALADGVLGGRLRLTSNLINLNQFMPEDGAGDEPPLPEGTTATGAENLDPIQVPANINLAIDADVRQVVYTNMKLRDLKGILRIADQAVVLENVEANALGGRMGFQGAYDTRDAKNPAFDFKFDLSRLNFQEAFNTLNTFQALAPVGRFINGAFNSTLIMSGTLDQNLMPRFSSLNAQGFLETLNAVVQNFKPLQAVGQKLNADFLSDEWRLQDSRNWFEIKDGAVELKPVETKVENVPMTISGRHGLNMDMNYNIQASIPRELLRKSGAGQAADAGLQALQDQAAKLGINFQQGEYINVLINLTGSIKQPRVGLKLLGTGGEGSIAESAKQQLEAEVQKQLEAGKTIAREKAQEVIDTARAVAREQLDKLKEEAKKQVEETVKEQGKEVTKNLSEEAKKKLGEVIDSTGVKTADDIKKELDKFNPFKKKKPAQDTVKKN